MRVLVGAAAAITSPTFVDVDEEPTAAGATPGVTVESLVRGPVASASVTAGDEPGQYRAVLDAGDHTDRLDRLTLTWSGVVAGLAQSHEQVVEVVDGHYATIPELRAHPDMADASRVPTATLRAHRDGFARLVERYRGASWVGRVARLDASWCSAGRLPHVFVREILSVTTAGDPVIGWSWADGRLTLPTGAYPDPVSITYTHGITGPIPEALRTACREYVRAAALQPDSGVARNALSWTDGQGGTYRTSTASWADGRPTGLMAVDDRLNEVEDHRIPGIA